MNKSQAKALTTGQRIMWKAGRGVWRSGRVLEQSLHPEAVALGRIAVSHNNHDVSWIEPRRLHFEENPSPARYAISPAPASTTSRRPTSTSRG